MLRRIEIGKFLFDKAPYGHICRFVTFRKFRLSHEQREGLNKIGKRVRLASPLNAIQSYKCETVEVALVCLSPRLFGIRKSNQALCQIIHMDIGERRPLAKDLERLVFPNHV